MLTTKINSDFDFFNTTYVLNFDSTFTTAYVINYIDYVVRVIAVLIHFIYIYFMFRVKKFRNISYFYMHFVIIISLLYCLHYAFYIGTGGPSFGSLQLNLLFCYISEQMWSILRYLRALSILLLAMYRLFAVHNINLYKKMNSGLGFIYMTMGASVIFSIILTFVLKYALNTTYSVYFCSPGYSNSVREMIISFVLNVIISNVVPTTLNLIAYLKIVSKLKVTRQSLDKANILESTSVNKPANTSKVTPNDFSMATSVFTTASSAASAANATNTNKAKKELNAKQSRFAKQFIFMNIAIVMSNLFSVMVDFMIVLATNPAFYYLDAMLWQFRPIARILFLLFQSMIPIISILYNPEVRFLKIFHKGNFLKRGFLCNSTMI
ncbi:hypothetical protein BpHYR1_018239 [Brachionus plicatilis]|uniref:G-protein coupled receptors family 1 profile domain-containing protein n=1 Tax=Brachionus plicatilis TaxID=10195 RepID=A0A3M7QW70_BRAPC|nr:hypothetical protein BpHYR1_018239 [Brachionus plicatilis]